MLCRPQVRLEESLEFSILFCEPVYEFFHVFLGGGVLAIMWIALSTRNAVDQPLELPRAINEGLSFLLNIRHVQMSVLLDFPLEGINALRELLASIYFAHVIERPVRPTVL